MIVKKIYFMALLSFGSSAFCQNFEYINSQGTINSNSLYNLPAFQFRGGSYIRSDGTYLVFQQNGSGSDKSFYISDFSEIVITGTIKANSTINANNTINSNSAYDKPAYQFRGGSYIRSDGTYLVFQQNGGGSDKNFYINGFSNIKKDNEIIYHSGNINREDVDFRANNIWAKEIRVSLTNPWADFVFSDNYKLKSLPDLESYIKQNGHLPEIPKFEEVESCGINICDLNTKLLQKIEELTLYMIAQDRKIAGLEKQNLRITALEAEIRTLKAASSGNE